MACSATAALGRAKRKWRRKNRILIILVLFFAVESSRSWNGSNAPKPIDVRYHFIYFNSNLCDKLISTLERMRSAIIIRIKPNENCLKFEQTESYRERDRDPVKYERNMLCAKTHQRNLNSFILFLHCRRRRRLRYATLCLGVCVCAFYTVFFLCFFRFFTPFFVSFPCGGMTSFYN